MSGKIISAVIGCILGNIIGFLLVHYFENRNNK